MKILIVEDEPRIMKALWEWFTLGGVEVLEAATAEKALELIDQADAILCDGWFPYQQRFQKSWALIFGVARKKNKRFVLMSGDAGLIERARANDVPAVHKPFSFEAVERKLGLTA